MRFAALLLLPGLAFAAPLPKMEPPSVEIKLSAKSPSVLEITIHNNGKESLDMTYRNSPLDHFTLDLHGDSGSKYTATFAADKEDWGKPGTLTIEAGKSHTLSVHTCHYLSKLGEPGQKITFKARLKLEKRTYTSEPLTVGHGDDDGGPIRKGQFDCGTPCR